MNTPQISNFPFLWVAVIGLLLTAAVGFIHALDQNQPGWLTSTAISLAAVAYVFKKG